MIAEFGKLYLILKEVSAASDSPEHDYLVDRTREKSILVIDDEPLPKQFLPINMTFHKKMEPGTFIVCCEPFNGQILQTGFDEQMNAFAFRNLIPFEILKFRKTLKR